VRESNPPLRLEGPPSCADRRTGRCRGHLVSRCSIHIFQRYRPRNRFELKMRRAGVEPALPTGGWVTATWARQCPADAICLMSSGTSGSRTHRSRRFELRRFAVCVPCRFSSSASVLDGIRTHDLRRDRAAGTARLPYEDRRCRLVPPAGDESPASSRCSLVEQLKSQSNPGWTRTIVPWL
jgi:hypothetical protein